MDSEKVTVRPARKGDDVLIDGVRYPCSFKAMVAEIGGEALGIVGVLHARPLTAFSKIDEQLKGGFGFIRKYIDQYRDLLNSYNAPIYAVCSKEIRGSSRFLKHVGFEHLEGDTWIWIHKL